MVIEVPGSDDQADLAGASHRLDSLGQLILAVTHPTVTEADPNHVILGHTDDGERTLLFPATDVSECCSGHGAGIRRLTIGDRDDIDIDCTAPLTEDDAASTEDLVVRMGTHHQGGQRRRVPGWRRFPTRSPRDTDLRTSESSPPFTVGHDGLPAGLRRSPPFSPRLTLIAGPSIVTS